MLRSGTRLALLERPAAAGVDLEEHVLERRSSAAAARWRPRGSAPRTRGRSASRRPRGRRRSSTSPISPICTPDTRTVWPWPGATAWAVGSSIFSLIGSSSTQREAQPLVGRGCRRRRRARAASIAITQDSARRLRRSISAHRHASSPRPARRRAPRLDLAASTQSTARSCARARSARAPAACRAARARPRGSPGPTLRAQVRRLLRLARDVRAQRRDARRASAGWCRGSGSSACAKWPLPSETVRSPALVSTCTHWPLASPLRLSAGEAGQRLRRLLEDLAGGREVRVRARGRSTTRRSTSFSQLGASAHLLVERPGCAR